MSNIAFIGAGNMNASIIGGLIKHGYSPKNIMVSNPSAPKRVALEQQYGIAQTNSNKAAFEFADIIVLGVKPYIIPDVCHEFSSLQHVDKKCFISVAAGCTIEKISQSLNCLPAIARAMPNTPSQLGLGMTGVYANELVTAPQRQVIETIVSSAGEYIWLDNENQIDAITSLSGSGPAYFFLFMEAMASRAISLGFSPEQSRKIIQQTALGAAHMVKESPTLEISQLRTNVTSKGGTTQAALNTFIEGDLLQLVEKSIDAAYHRAQELAQ